MNSSHRALVGLGTNLPFQGRNGPGLLEDVLGALDATDLRVTAVSSAWRSLSWPDTAQPAFVNAVAALDVGERQANAVYGLLADMERRFGRQRDQRWGARTVDLDLLDLDGVIAEIDGVIIPHPRMAERRFVLEPLKEVDPKWVHPVLGSTVDELLATARVGEGIQRIGPLRIAPRGLTD